MPGAAQQDEGRRSAAPTALGVAASLAALLLAAPRPSAAVAELASASAAGDPTAPLVAAVALAAWAVSSWLALTVAVVLLSRLPGLLGRLGTAVAARIAPVAVRRAVEATLGLTVAVGTLAPSAALAVTETGPAAPSVSSTAAVDATWDLDWPASTAVRPPPVASSAPTSPAATSPAATSPATAPPAVRSPAAQAPAPPAGSATRPRTAAPPVSVPTVAPPAVDVRPPPVAAASVVVRPGDSLWRLAEASLRRAGTAPTDRLVAQEWPRWWAANREVVGDDPDLLLPGAVLRPPPAATDPA